MPVSGNAGNTGIHLLMAIKVTRPSKATSEKGKRHDNKWHISVKPGTPIRLATVMPPIRTATAEAPFPGAANLEQTMAPAPKKAPWGNPAINLATNMQP